MQRDPDSPQHLAYGVNDAAAALGIKRSKLCEIIAADEIKSFKVGRRRLISRVALEEFIATREAAETASSGL